MRSLDLSCHMRQLQPDDRVIDQLLSKSSSLVGVFHRFVVADSSESGRLDSNSKTLVVEVRHDDFEPLVFLANEVLYRDLDVFKGDVRCARCPDTLAVHFPGGDTRHRALDEEDGYTTHARLAGADGYGEVV